MNKDIKLYTVCTDYACAGIEVDEKGIVIDAAPIFSWMIGKTFIEVKKWQKIKKIREA